MTAWTVAASSGAAITAVSIGAAIAMSPKRAARRGRRRLGNPWGASRLAGWLRKRVERRAVTTALPVLLEMVARSLRSGHSARSALMEAGASIGGPLADDIDVIARRLEVGATLRTALGHWVRCRADVPGVRLASSAIALAADSGGSVAAAVDGVADTLREEHALVAEVRSLAAQARASAALIVALPLVFALIAAIADPRVLGFLTRTDIGRTCLGLGIALDAVALMWMHRIVAEIAR